LAEASEEGPRRAVEPMIMMINMMEQLSHHPNNRGEFPNLTNYVSAQVENILNAFNSTIHTYTLNYDISSNQHTELWPVVVHVKLNVRRGRANLNDKLKNE
jgi:hypothetical protein